MVKQNLLLFSALSLTACGVLLSVTLNAAEPPRSGNSWVPYTAIFTESSTLKDASGHETRTQKTMKQTQSADGSQRTVYLQNGQPVGGKLISANGDMYSLDFNNKQATPIGNKGPRGHSKIPKQAPLGTETIANLTCTVFPMQARGAAAGTTTGSICVDTADDVPLKLEIHNDDQGMRQDYVQQVTSITLYPADAPSTQQLPEGFVALKR